jgi:hypothetical protein
MYKQLKMSSKNSCPLPVVAGAGPSQGPNANRVKIAGGGEDPKAFAGWNAEVGAASHLELCQHANLQPINLKEREQI